MGPSPKTHPLDPKPEAKALPVTPKKVTVAPPPPVLKKAACFAMDKPAKPGMLLVSTDKLQGGCYVLEWEKQSAIYLVSDTPAWFQMANNMLKVNIGFCTVFAFCLIFVLVMTRVHRQ